MSPDERQAARAKIENGVGCYANISLNDGGVGTHYEDELIEALDELDAKDKTIERLRLDISAAHARLVAIAGVSPVARVTRLPRHHRMGRCAACS